MIQHLIYFMQIAKLVGDLFNKGIYEIQIELKKTPFLEWEGPGQMERFAQKCAYSTLYMYVDTLHVQCLMNVVHLQCSFISFFTPVIRSLMLFVSLTFFLGLDCWPLM